MNWTTHDAVAVVLPLSRKSHTQCLNWRNCISLGQFTLTLMRGVVGDFGEDELTIRPKSKSGSEAQTYDVCTDVVGENAVPAHQVVAKPQAPDCYYHCDRIKSEEHQVFSAHIRPATLAESPVPVTEVGESCGNCHADNLRRNWAVIHRPLATGKAQ